MGEIKRIRSQKGDLFLASMTPEVTEAYELLQFSTILKSYPDVDQALQLGFGKGKAAKGTPVPKAAKPAASTEEKAPLRSANEKKAAPLASAESSGVKTPVATPIASQPKPGWFGKILKPWTWF